jgi:hypothetical protein
MKNKVVFYRCLTLAGLMTLILFLVSYPTEDPVEALKLWITTQLSLTFVFTFFAVNCKKIRRDAWGSISRQ